MNRNQWYLLGALTFLLAVTPASAAEPKTVAGKVVSVTLYRGQALVTRAVPAEGPKGNVEIIVSDLPQHIVEGSLFAEAGEALEVRAVRLRQRAVGEEPREEVRKLDLQLQDLGDQVLLNQKNQELATKKAVYLDGLEGFVAPTAKTELSKGVLNAEALEKLTTFSFTERQKIAAEQIALIKEQRELNEQAALLQNKKAELTNGKQRVVNEAVLFLDKRGDGAETIQLNYLVNSCGWSPTYAFRAAKDRKTVEVEYNALIQQMTGENWEGVTLTLSTASPALSAAGPGLAPFYVSLARQAAPNAAPEQKSQGAQQDIAGQYKGIKERQQVAQQQLQNTTNFADNLGFNWAVNGAANDVQALELVCPTDVLATIRSESGDDSGPSITYRLEGPVSLASRSDQQMVRILKNALPSTFYHVATPVLASYVHREAELKNTSTDDLMAGPISVYLDGRFVGRAEIPTVARGETFVVGFGADAQLRAHRELVDKKEGVQGGNRELSFKYRLAVENYKPEAATVRVFDRLPYAEHGSDVRVALGDLKTPLSTDPTYLRTERTKGLLRWDVEVPVGSTAEKPLVIEYSFTVDFDRNFQLSAAGAKPDQQQEFEQLQRGRLKK